MHGAKRSGVSSLEFKDLPRREEPAGENNRMVYERPVCPAKASHHGARIYRRMGKFAYCVCDDCGETWKVPKKID